MTRAAREIQDERALETARQKGDLRENVRFHVESRKVWVQL